MFGLGVTEIVVILVVALLFIGPDKLPEVAKSLGKGLRELRKVTDDVRDTVNTTVNDAVREVAKRPEPVAKATPATATDPPSTFPLPGSGMTGEALPSGNVQPAPGAEAAEPAPTSTTVAEERVPQGKPPVV